MEGIHTVSKFFLLRHSNLSPKGFLSSSLRHGEAVLAKKVFLKHLNMLSWQKTGKPATSEINQTQKAFEQQCWQGSLFGSWSLPKQRSLPLQTLQGSWATEPPCSTAVQANQSWWHDFWSRTFTSFKGQETLNLQRIFFSYTSCIVLQTRFIFFPTSFETSLHTPSNQQKQRQQTNNFKLKLSKFDYHLSCIFNSNAILIFFGALFFPPMGSSASAHLQWWWGSRWCSRSELVILHCCKMKWTCLLHISDLQHVQWLVQGLGVPTPWKCKDWVPVNNSDKIFTKRKQTKLPWWGKIESHHVKFSRHWLSQGGQLQKQSGSIAMSCNKLHDHSIGIDLSIRQLKKVKKQCFAIHCKETKPNTWPITASCR